MFHEQAVLRYEKDQLFELESIKDSVIFTKGRKEKIVAAEDIPIDFSLENDNWGEKIPYYNLRLRKNDFNIDLVKYCARWNSYFQDDSRIIHIIRHPVDVCISNKNSGYSPNFQDPFDLWFKNVPKVVKNFERKFDNVLTIKYEDLILDSARLLEEIYAFCKLDSSSTVIEEILSGKSFYKFKNLDRTRAFNYRNLPNFDATRLLKPRKLLYFGVNYEKVLDKINQFGQLEYSM